MVGIRTCSETFAIFMFLYGTHIESWGNWLYTHGNIYKSSVASSEQLSCLTKRKQKMGTQLLTKAESTNPLILDEFSCIVTNCSLHINFNRHLHDNYSLYIMSWQLWRMSHIILRELFLAIYWNEIEREN